MRRNDPRIRQTLNQISHNLESANESAQANIFTFSQNFVNPCLSGVSTCLEASCAPCYPAREERLRRNRGRPRGRAELSFDFYDDWDNDNGAGDGLLGWGNDELDRLLAGSGERDGHADQPRRQRTMSYGSRRGDGRLPSGRVRSGILPNDGGPDPTIIPRTSILGFLERLPWKIGGRGVRYRPSAADLQERPGIGRRRQGEGDPLIEETDESGEEARAKKHRRKRSATSTSRSTTNSLSSRGDLFPSEDEDDAVPLDDEFAMVLERRVTGPASDDHGSGKTSSGQRLAPSRTSTKTASSRDTRSTGKKGRGESVSAEEAPNLSKPDEVSPPSMVDLKKEEERVLRQEEEEIEWKRQAAQRLALQRGLSGTEEEIKSPTQETKSGATASAEEIASPLSPLNSQDVEPEIAQPHPHSHETEEMRHQTFVPAQLPHFARKASEPEPKPPNSPT
ncbi:MAG: hypothetical protein M1830_003758 [Pleopsidium flavum]|nr:MAG: hypothetical protein M1830_003758 [Pleopsidium flavum]